MKILIVEDTPDRQELLRRLLAGHDIVVVDSAEAAVGKLRGTAFDLVFLDYDLAGEGTGGDVASFLTTVDAAPEVVVHSMNPEGVAAIRAVLPDAHPVPIDRLHPRTALYSRLRAGFAAHQPIGWSDIEERI